MILSIKVADCLEKRKQVKEAKKLAKKVSEGFTEISFLDVFLNSMII